MIYSKTMIAAVIALGTLSGSALAQVNANNLVNVNISNNDIANDIARNLNVDVQDVLDIGSVQAPIGVAATVCNVQANVLAADNKGEGAACDAQSSSQALTQIVKRQLKS